MHPTEKNRIVIDEDAAPMVRRIFGMACFRLSTNARTLWKVSRSMMGSWVPSTTTQSVSCRQIAARLNAEGVPTPAARLSTARG